MVQTTLPFGLFTPKRSSNVENKSNVETASKSGTYAIKNKIDSDPDSKSKHKQLKLGSPPKSSPKSLTLGSQFKSEKEMAIDKRKFNDYDDDDDDDIEIIELKFNDIQGGHNDKNGNNFGQLSTPSSLKRQKINTSPTPMKIINKLPQNSVKSKKEEEEEEEEEEEDDSNMYDSDSSLSSVGSTVDTSECLEVEDITSEDKENTTPGVENDHNINCSSKSETLLSKNKSKKKAEDPEKSKAKLEQRRLKNLKLKQEKLEKNLKKEEEARIREEKKRQIDLEKQKKKEELERKRKEREEIELEKKRKREEAETERKKRKEEHEKVKKLKEMKRLQEKEEKELKKLQEKEEKELKKLQEKEDKEQQKLQEEEKRRREQEKKKKQQITSFFKIVKSNEKDSDSNDSSNGLNDPSLNNSSTYSSNDSVLNLLSANSMKISDSAVSNDNTNNGVSSMNNANNSSPVKKKIYAYKDYFLEFYIKSNSKITNNFPSFEETENRKILFDAFLASNVSEEQSFNSFLNSSECDINDNSKDYKIISSTDVIQTINMGLSKEAQQLITKVNVKYLQFYENAKPAYCGTYSKCINDCNTELQFAPYTRLPLTDKFTLDYEFDSDLEGDNDEENDEEGDLIDSHDEEDDDDDDDEDDDDMDEDEGTNDKFLVEDDDEKNNGGASKSKRKIAGPLIPVVKWFGMKNEDTDQSDILMQNIDYFDNLQYERLHTKIDFPIDPLKDYWTDISEAENKTNTEISKEEKSKKLEDNENNKNNKKEKTPGASNSSNNSSNSPLKKLEEGKQDQTTKGSNESEKEVKVLTPRKQKKFISNAEDLKQLVDFISKNNAFSISTLTELFQMTVINHKYSKTVVRNSIQNVASFDPQKKKWAIN